MNDQLLHLIIKQKITLVAICVIIGLLVMVFLLWIYAEITFYRQKYVGTCLNDRTIKSTSTHSFPLFSLLPTCNQKTNRQLERIEAVRDKMDGIELSMRQRRNSRQHQVIKMKNLDATPRSHRHTKYSKITIDSRRVENV